jgi:predicted Zn-dependent peptidase
MKRWMPLAVTAALLAALAVGRTRAEDEAKNGGSLEGLASKVNEIQLENGLRVLVLERHGAPTVAFVTAVNVGSVDETTGETGLAHLFEHMAFKGSTTVGTKDWPKEKAALEEVEKCFLHLRELEVQGADKARLDEAKKALEQAQEEAGKYVEPEEYSKIIERNGGSGLNAFTYVDQTVYHVEMPANRLELWFALESDRFRDNVLREFYKEKQAVEEERRMRTESSPEGKLAEEFLECAFRAHPYARPTIGYMSDLDALSATTARKFFAKHYTASNMTIGIVGDVQTSEVKRLAEKYFGPMPKLPKNEPVPTIEPRQEGLRRIEVESAAQPMVFLGWHGPAARETDSVALDALTDVMSSGRTSRLYRSLVVEKKVAVQAGIGWGEPGQKYPNLIMGYAVPAPKKTCDQCVAAFDEEVEKVKAELVTEDELKVVKTRARANFLRGLRGNLGLAESLAMRAGTYWGDWKGLFDQIAKIDKLTREDLRKVAQKYLVRSSLTRGDIVKPSDKNNAKEKE